MTLGSAMIIAGVCSIVGTAGMSDLDLIGFPQIIVPSILGLILMYGGFYICHLDAD